MEDRADSSRVTLAHQSTMCPYSVLPGKFAVSKLFAIHEKCYLYIEKNVKKLFYTTNNVVFCYFMSIKESQLENIL